MAIRYLKDGLPKILPNHLTREAKALRQAWLALQAELGPFQTEVIRWEAVRVARLWVGVQERSSELETARYKHNRPGGGRRPDAEAAATLAARHEAAEDRLARLRAVPAAPAGNAVRGGGTWRARGGGTRGGGAWARAFMSLLREGERRMIIDALQKTGGVRARAAKALGISERSLWYRVKKLKIPTRPGEEEPPPR